MSLLNKDRTMIWHPFTQHLTQPPVLPVVRAKDALFETSDGRTFIDAISSWWVTLHGHCNPQVQAAIAEQSGILDHIIFAGTTHPPAVNVAESLLKLLPKEFSRVFFSDNGSTAVETAIKMALQYWHNKDQKRSDILVLEGSYHGDTTGCMSVSKCSLFNKPFEPLLFDVHTIPLKDKECSLDWLQKKLRSVQPAAIIYEPLVQAVNGMRFLEANHLADILRMCRQAGVILIADEVFTGMGRTGRFLASEYMPITPDIVCLAKGLSGGSLPLAVTVTQEKLFEAFLAEDLKLTFLHGHSYSGNPICCAAAYACLELFKDKATWSNLSRISTKHKEFVHELRQAKLVSNPRELGTLLAFEIDTQYESGYFNELRDKLLGFYHNRGIFLRPLGNTVYILPPYCITNEQLDAVYEAIRGSLEFVAQVTRKS